MTGRRIRRMESGWRFVRRRRAGYESDRFRLMLFDRTGGASGAGGDSASQSANASAGPGATEQTESCRIPPTEAPALQELLPKFDRWIDEFVWGPDSRAIYIASGDAGRTVILRFQFEGETGEPFRIVSADGEFSDLQISRDGNHIGGEPDERGSAGRDQCDGAGFDGGAAMRRRLRLRRRNSRRRFRSFPF